MSLIKIADRWSLSGMGTMVLDSTDSAVCFISQPPKIKGEDFVEYLKTIAHGFITWNAYIKLPSDEFSLSGFAFWIINPSVEVMRICLKDDKGNIEMRRYKFDGTKDIFTLPLEYDAIDNFDAEIEELVSGSPIDLLDYFMSNPAAYVQPYLVSAVNGMVRHGHGVYTYISDPHDLIRGSFVLPIICNNKPIYFYASEQVIRTTPSRSSLAMIVNVECDLKQTGLDEDEVFDELKSTMVGTKCEYTINSKALKFPFQYWCAVTNEEQYGTIGFTNAFKNELTVFINKVSEPLNGILSTKVDFSAMDVSLYRTVELRPVDEDVVSVQ